MSGFEVVGVVFGAIPLIISGLELYADGVETIKTVARAAQEFRDVARRLETENSIFRNNIELLLSDCVDVSLQKQLMDDVEGSEWTNPAVVEALQYRLQSSFTSYIETAQSIGRSVDKFKTRLHMGPQGQLPFSDKYSFRQTCKRFRFALKKEKYMDLIEDINHDNTRLHRLTEQTRALQSRRTAKHVPDFEKIRAGAVSVFESLKRGLQVSCGAPHKASLCLNSTKPQPISKYPTKKVEENSIFRVVLHHDVGPKARATGWSIEEAEIRMLDSLVTASASSFVSIQGSSVTAAVSTGKKTVQWQSTSSATSSSATITVSTPTSSTSNSNQIHDLCRSIEAFRAAQCGACLGYIECQITHRQCELYRPTDRLLDQTLSVQTLSTILNEKARSGDRLSQADARRLAVPLAFGLLRFYNTPWLDGAWSNNSVLLVSQNGKLLSEHPFVSQKMTAALPSANLPLQGLAASVIKNPTLFALGILLVELTMEKPMSDLHKSDELNADGTKHDLSDYQTADRLLRNEDISNRFGMRWSDAVSRCIYCDVEQTRRNQWSLEDAGFRKAVWSEVVAQLEEDHRQFFGL